MGREIVVNLLFDHDLGFQSNNLYHQSISFMCMCACIVDLQVNEKLERITFSNSTFDFLYPFIFGFYYELWILNPWTESPVRIPNTTNHFLYSVNCKYCIIATDQFLITKKFVFILSILKFQNKTCIHIYITIKSKFFEKDAKINIVSNVNIEKHSSFSLCNVWILLAKTHDCLED